MPTLYDGRGTKRDLVIARGYDMAFELVVTDSVGAAVNLSAATIAGEIYTTAGTLVDTMTAVVSGAGSNVVTLSFTDTETAAFTDKSYLWSLTVTRGGDKRPWLAGRVNVTDGTSGASPTSGTQSFSVDGDLTVSVSVGAVGPAAQAASSVTNVPAGNIAATNVQAAINELDTEKAPLASPTFTGSVIVPAGDAANEAAQITAYNATTGQLAIASVELGNTGRRQVKTLLINGWVADNLFIQRVGKTVFVTIENLFNGAATDLSFLAQPTGFTQSSGWFSNGNALTAGFSPLTVATAVIFQSGNFRMSSASVERLYATFSYTTAAAWPASLPGTSDTAPFTG